MNAAYILWVRQLKKYFRSKARMLASLAQPLLFLVAFGFGFGPIYAKAGGGDYIQFLAPGIIMMAVMFTAIFNGIEIIWDKQFGFLKETLVAPVSRFSIMLGRTLGGATVATIQGVIVFLITLLVGFHPVSILNALVGLIFMFLTALLFAAFGAAIASMIDDAQAFPLILNFVAMPLFFLSGALFPLGNLSGVLHYLTILNPISYGVDGVRTALTGMAQFNYGLDAVVLMVVDIVVLSFGAYLFSKVEA